MALRGLFWPFPRVHPLEPRCHVTVLQLLLSPGVSEDICFPESSVPVVIFVCRTGKSTPSVCSLRNAGCTMEVGVASFLLLIHHFTWH